MGADGAQGLLAMRKAGARTLGQNEATCVVYGMPKVAQQIGAVEKQAPLNAIAAEVVALATRNRD
jgi:two-component system chemotaxis response regulator CheB